MENKALKNWGGFIFVMTTMYSSVIAILLVCSFLFNFLIPIDNASEEIITEILVFIFVMPIFKLQWYIGEQIIEKLQRFNIMSKLSDLFIAALLSIILFILIIIPSVVYFGNYLSPNIDKNEFKSNYSEIKNEDSKESDYFVNDLSSSENTPPKTPSISPTSTFQIKCSYTVVDNNHVGDSWRLSYKITGDIKILGNYAYLVNEGDTITLSAKMEELDDIIDVGSNSITRTISKSDIYYGFTTSFYITVKENRGQFYNNTALIKVMFEFIPVK